MRQILLTLFYKQQQQKKKCMRLWELKEITEGQNPSKQRSDPNSKDSESCAFSRQPR